MCICDIEIFFSAQVGTCASSPGSSSRGLSALLPAKRLPSNASHLWAPMKRVKPFFHTPGASSPALVSISGLNITQFVCCAPERLPPSAQRGTPWRPPFVSSLSAHFVSRFSHHHAGLFRCASLRCLLMVMPCCLLRFTALLFPPPLTPALFQLTQPGSFGQLWPNSGGRTFRLYR